jgi:hypothetical protein
MQVEKKKHVEKLASQITRTNTRTNKQKLIFLKKIKTK